LLGCECGYLDASSTLSRQEGDSIQTVDLEGQLNLIDAAKAANVSRFVLISFPPLDVEFPLQAAKRRVEEDLKSSGLTYTILQPTLFMEVWLSPVLGFDAANAKAQIYGSGENKISWISCKDVAKFAVASLDHPAARKAVIELGGPEALNPLEVVRTFEELQGRKFDVQHVPEEALREQRKGASDPLQQSFAGLMLHYSRGHVIDMRETLQKFPARLSFYQRFCPGQHVTCLPMLSNNGMQRTRRKRAFYLQWPLRAGAFRQSDGPHDDK
jgi:uncharacterized protein YbjT (DUF2867 family)